METVQMSAKEANKIMIIGQILEKKLSQKEGSARLGISTRQIRRITRRLQLQGPCAVVHRNRGKPSNNRRAHDFNNQILALLKEKYNDFGPTFAKEKLLALNGIKVSTEWLRQLMLTNGLWQQKQRKNSIHKPRTRRPQYGELLQIDGSHHAWFEERGPKCD